MSKERWQWIITVIVTVICFIGGTMAFSYFVSQTAGGHIFAGIVIAFVGFCATDYFFELPE